MPKTIWFDFTNPPHVNLYLPFINFFKKEHDIICSARHFVETISLLKQNNCSFLEVGKHGGKSKLSKLLAFASRDLQLVAKIPYFDISISSNYEAPHVSWLKRKKSIVFDDNDISPNWLYAKFANYVICPEAINRDKMISMGISPAKLITYTGFKEDIYIADYKPDPDFPDKIPFTDYVVVRPENLFASYIPKNANSIVPGLFKKLSDKGFNILYLPRYQSDHHYVKEQENIYIPEQPLRGLDVCYHSKAVLTGAGTFSREASLMGIPAVSFYAGSEFLSVDVKLFNEKKILFSRNVDEIVEYISSSQKGSRDFTRSSKVQREVFDIVNRIINS